ncbi:putative C-type lectin domain family 20 member A [Toxotes jaculatrix]|uniref:putative C-type lectin domain family 20 member A n=1 Tax=Toxotes jaculatrix TaxID=941984 RepID=UPI001B3ADED2|nr:putative C-type lectin domain family 20 member A [Toxotes jaculatrix]
METTGVVILLLLAQSTLSLGTTREYHLVQLLKNWTEAQSYCREHFVDLATIETAEEWDRVKTIFNSSGQRAWIGLYNDVKDWKWSLNDTYLDREVGDWLGSQVDNYQGLEWCVEMQDTGALNDVSCSYLRRSMCYDESTNEHIPVIEPMTWVSAQQNCRDKYTDLTSIRDEQEKEKIRSMISGYSYWIGLHRLGWTWSDPSDSSLHFWLNTEPSGGQESCVWASPEGWADHPCDVKYPFICSVPVMKVLKVVVSSEGSVDLNDPLVQEAVLNYMTKRMKDSRIPQKFRLRWRKQPNGKVFN